MFFEVIPSNDLSFFVDTWLGNDTEDWKEIGAMEIARKLSAQANGRVTVGYPLCEFTSCSEHVAHQFLGASVS